MKKKNVKSRVYTLCVIALLTAMMLLLKRTAAIETPYFKFSFASLPIVLASMIFGPAEGTAVAVLGEFAAQVTGPYGLVPTTFIWIWPPALRALAVGGAALWCRRCGTRLESRPVLCYAACVAGSVLVTSGNTFGMWLESLFYRTSFTPVLFFIPGRYITGVATAAAMATVVMPLMHALRRSGALNGAD